MGDNNNQEELKAQLEDKIRGLEDEMNQAFAELQKLDDEKLEYEDIQEYEDNMEGWETFPTEEEDSSATKDEAETFLGANPAVAASAEIDLRDDLLARIKSWLSKGLATKEEKENLLKSIPRKGKLNLEAPLLNDEIIADTHPKAQSRDDFFRDYQNLTGSSLSAVSTVLNMILKDGEEPLEREKVLSNLSNSVKLLSHLFYALNQARKSFIMGKYEERIQKVLKKVESTTFLFGDNLKTAIDSSKAMVKVSKELKPKNKPNPKPYNSLNWRNSPGTKEVNRTSYRGSAPRGYTSRNYKSRPYPMKKNYPQSQPQQNRQ